MSKTALILKGDSYKAVGAIFEERGYHVIYPSDGPQKLDLVVFTGGSDVSPYIYGEEPDGARGCDPKRDDYEVSVYKWAQALGLPCVGICRGGQLLNVLNGGKMIQHLGETISGDVDVWDDIKKEHVVMRVDHHQGMLMSYHDSVPELAWLDGDMTEQGYKEIRCFYSIVYPSTKSLCFQPHPEWGHQGTKDYFFELVNKYIGTSEV